MEVVTTIEEMSKISEELKKKNKTVGFVPTMGALHMGHINLCIRSKQTADITIMSVFVNPTQFAPHEDFNKYPRDIKKDIELAKKYNVDYIFAPTVEEMYPDGFSTNIFISGVADLFEGAKRPGHFNGVALVVAKLFNIINPDYSFFGQKDYQQVVVIKKMVSELNFRTKIVLEPIARLESGLAMSSRNVYLTETEKINASNIYKVMLETKRLIEDGLRTRKTINETLVNKLSEISDLKIDYAVAALSKDLSEPEIFENKDEIIILMAAYVGKTRLIDNMLIQLN